VQCLLWAPFEQMSEKDRADIFKTTADAARKEVALAEGRISLRVRRYPTRLVSRLLEDGVLPGLDAAMEEYGNTASKTPRKRNWPQRQPRRLSQRLQQSKQLLSALKSSSGYSLPISLSR
jgi:hypothetical protein